MNEFTLPEATPQFARMATEVWGIDPEGKTELELAEGFIEALASFIKEINLPTTFTEMGITEGIDYRAIAETTLRMAGCVKQFSTDELLEVLEECR